MRNEIYASTGAFTGMANGYSYEVIKELYPRLCCDGIELMMYSAWYGKLEEVMDTIASYGMNIPVVHFDKCIGIHLAQHTAEDIAEAKRKFSLNVWAANRVGAKKAVFHLWGGENSDIFIERSLKYLPEFYRECDEAGIDLLIENIPSRYHGAYSNLCRVRDFYPDARFIYDTRFGEYHAEHVLIMRKPIWERVRHIHISSYDRTKKGIWGLIRPILHPGEGCVDLPALVKSMPEYTHSVTLESPVLSKSGEIDVEKLNASLLYLREVFGGKEE